MAHRDSKKHSELHRGSNKQKKPRQELNLPDFLIERARRVAMEMLPKDEAIECLTNIAAVGQAELTQKNLSMIPIIDEEGIAVGGRSGKVSRSWLFPISLHLRGIYLEEGEEALLKVLPYWLNLDCMFFLSEKWIRKIFSEWLARGDEEKIKRAFFGKSRAGIRSFKLSVQNHERDVKIAAKIDSLIEQGYGYNAAIREVRNNLKDLGIQESLSLEAIRSIHKKIRTPGYHPPLIKLFE